MCPFLPIFFFLPIFGASLVPKLAEGPEVGRGLEIDEIDAIEENEEMRSFARKRRKRDEFHANEEIEELL